MKLKKRFKIKKIPYILSPLKLAFVVLIVWVVAFSLGVGLNNVIIKYIPYSDNVQYVFLIVGFIVVSAIIGLGIAYLITNKGMRWINNLNEVMNKISEGDFSAELNIKTKNEQLDNLVFNFNQMIKQLNSVVVLKNDFVFGFSHEFKTPIVSIKGYAELLESADNLTEEQKEFARIIIEESARLSALSKNVMILAKIDSQSISTVNKLFLPDSQLEDCVLMFDSAFKEKSIDVDINLQGGYVKSDPDLIKEIWINLISNAVKFSNKGGKIEIKSKLQNGKYIVSVSDNGVGMTNEVKQRIYEKYFQADNSHIYKGLGLGLSIVSRILEIVNGKIICESEVGKGTTMVVELPENI